MIERSMFASTLLCRLRIFAAHVVSLRGIADFDRQISCGFFLKKEFGSVARGAGRADPVSTADGFVEREKVSKNSPFEPFPTKTVSPYANFA